MSRKKNEAVGAISLTEVRNLCRLAIWAALISLGGWVSFPLAGVPVTLQTFFVILAGFKEGPQIGFWATCLYLLAGVLGLPVFAGGQAGPAVLLGPTAGFALAFPLAAALAGLASVRRRGRFSAPLGALFGLAAACGVVYAGGVVGLLVNAGLNWAAIGAILLSCLPGDLLKVAAACAICLADRRPASNPALAATSESTGK